MAKSNGITPSDKNTLLKILENESKAKLLDAEGEKERQKTYRQAIKVQAEANKQNYNLGLTKIEKDSEKDKRKHKLDSFKTILTWTILAMFVLSIITIGIILIFTGKETIGMHIIGYAATAVLSAIGGAGFANYKNTEKKIELSENNIENEI